MEQRKAIKCENLIHQQVYHFLLIFQNNLLPSGEKSLVAKSLVIESVDRHEAGIYICEAKNGVGHKSATASIKLQVLCKLNKIITFLLQSNPDLRDLSVSTLLSLN